MIIKGLYTIKKITDYGIYDMPPTTKEKAINDYNALIRYMTAMKDEDAIIVILTMDDKGNEITVARTVVSKERK